MLSECLSMKQYASFQETVYKLHSKSVLWTQTFRMLSAPVGGVQHEYELKTPFGCFR